MSYILDALKKAERQRRLGQVPRLETSHADGIAPRRRVWPWLWAAVLAVNGILLALILRHSENPPSASQPASQSASRSVPQSSAQTAASRQPAASGQSSSALVLAANERAVMTVSAQKSAAKPAHRPPAPASHSAPPVRLAQQHGHAAAHPAVSAPAAAPVPAAAAPAAVPPPMPAPAQPSAGSVPAAAAHTGSAEASAAPSIAAPIPLLQDLPFEFQKTVPPVRIDAMVYSDNEQSRMAFLNGHKYREGQQLEGSDLKVETILRQGVVLSQGGQRFLLTP